MSCMKLPHPEAVWVHQQCSEHGGGGECLTLDVVCDPEVLLAVREWASVCVLGQLELGAVVLWVQRDDHGGESFAWGISLDICQGSSVARKVTK